MQTKMQEYSKALGVAEEELLNELRGYYKPSFFYMYLKGDYKTDIGQLSIKDQGTFIHEYIHYIQNIATFWGLYCSIVRYQELIEIKAHLIESDELTIPLAIQYSEDLKRKIARVNSGNGLLKFDEHNSWNIDVDHIIGIQKKHNGISEIIILTVKFKDSRTEKIELGAHIIKESMAAMYQSLIDEKVEHDDIPYNLIKILCDQHFSNISADTEKLICICYSSLFSMSPASELISLLEIASANPALDGMDIFTEFIDTRTITSPKGNKYSVVHYFDILVRGFRKALTINLQADLDYINEVLERIKLSNGWVPYLTILYDEKQLSPNNFNALIGYLGIPYIQTLQNGFHFPKSTKKNAGDEDSSVDVLELIAQEAMFSYLIMPRKDKICPLYYMCNNTTYDKDECFGSPWKGNQCSFTIVSSPFSMDKKKITWKF